MRRVALLLLAPLALTAAACELPVDDGGSFREAIPSAGELSTRVPGPNAPPAAARASGVHTQKTASAASDGERPRVHRLLRSLADDADEQTARLVDLAWDIAHTPPRKVQGATAVWAPTQRPGLKSVWRLSVTDVGGMEVDYLLEGRPQGSTVEQDFQVVLRGHAYQRAHAKHHSGFVTIESDALRELEPGATRATGKLKVSYDRVGRDVIAVELRARDARRWADLTVTHLEKGAGTIDLKGAEPFDLDDDAHDDAPADLVLRGRWTGDGAGRADAVVSRGDPRPAKISECWSPSYARVYARKDDESTGSVSSCAFQEPAL